MRPAIHLALFAVVYQCFVGSFKAARFRRRKALLDVPTVLKSTIDDRSIENNQIKNDFETSETSFWGSTRRKIAPKVPFAELLDRLDGPLPPGAYRVLGDAEKQADPKPVCRLSVAIDLWNKNIDSDVVVANIQRMRDAGFCTFLLNAPSSAMREWGEDNLIGRFMDETPDFATRDCHFVLAEEIPGKDCDFSRARIRNSILNRLDRTGCEAVDTLQLNHRSESPYHLEMLDVVQDLQRDGFVRSVSAMNITKRSLQAVRRCGFTLSGFHKSGNLLIPQKKTSDGPTWITSPLAGGFLTERHVDKVLLPLPWEMTEMERMSWKNTMMPWGRNRKADTMTKHDVWRLYQDDVLSVLSEIALKHRVSAAAVALRWCMQIQPEQIASVTATCSLMNERGDESRFRRHRSLRDVFRFELDDEDMDILASLAYAAQEPPKDSMESMLAAEQFLLENPGRWDEIDEDIIRKLEGMEGSLSDEFEIDFNNQKLWL